MLQKPDSCHTCPLYHDGMGYVPDSLVPNASVVIAMQNPGFHEEQQGVPAIGDSGEYLNHHFLPLAGLSREEVSVVNILKCRWYNPRKKEKTNDLPSKVGLWNEEKQKWDKAKGNAVEQLAVEQCVRLNLAIPSGTKLIVTLGELSSRSLAGIEKVTEWRGHLAPTCYQGIPVFVSLHPSYLLQNPKMSIPAMIDWKRIGLFLAGKFPEPVPSREIVDRSNASLLDTQYVPSKTAYATFDLEYNPENKQPFLAGIAYFNHDGVCLGGVQVWTEEIESRRVQGFLRRVFSHVPTVMHNCVADMEVAYREWEIQYRDYLKVIDTIQLHAVAHSEWPHGLDFCESLYGRHRRMKHLFDENVLLYNWGDCLTTGYTYHQLRQIETTDPLSYRVYETENMPVVPIRLQSKLDGIRLDRVFLSTMSDQLEERAEASRRLAEMYAQVSISSPEQLKHYLTQAEGFTLPKSRETGNFEMDKDVVAELRRNFLDCDPEDEKDGITVAQLLQNIEQGGHPLLEARACYQNSGILRSHFILPLLKPGVPRDRSHYDPDDFVERCAPDQHTHAQASGRCSTVSPPLPTLKKMLRKMIIPDRGEAMVGFDFDQQELRIDAHLSDDEQTIEAFTHGYDIHTLNTCDVFQYQYPPDLKDPHESEVNSVWRANLKWDGKDDRRRVFNKRFVYRIRYRGNPRFAGDIPGAKVLGLSAKDLETASRNYLAKHPNVLRYWQRIDTEVLKSRTARTPTAVWHGIQFGGRKRFLNGYGVKSKPGEVPPICRENTNHPMQGFGADVLYVSLCVIHRATRDLHARWGYGAHDSQKWFVPDRHVQSFQERVLDIMHLPYTVKGTALVLPITMDKPTYAPEELNDV